MYSNMELIAIVVAYALLLTGAGFWIDRKAKRESRTLMNSPWIYSLSLAVYCTSWTFYGSVGSASKSGMLFLAIYLGPMLSMTLWWSFLKKMALIKAKYRLTSAIDLISARFDKSTGLGMFGAIFIVVGIVPYIALQLKSFHSTWSILIHVPGAAAPASPALFTTVGFITVAALSAITIFFGIRKLDSTERHPGMMFIVAIESAIKLFALVAVGVFATYFINDGYGELLDQLPSLVDPEKYNFMGDSKNTLTDFSTWVTYLLLAASAVIFLPRQFHVGVIENENINNIKKAKWQFPLYLFLINLFVLPIAIAGLKLGLTGKEADYFVLGVPLQSNNHYLALFAFIGGVSAAVGMIVIETMALSTIFSNHVLVPLISRIKILNFFSKYILQLRWVSATGVIALAYWYMGVIGGKYALVSMGMISFAATLQFAPIILAALYWKKASRVGAYWGLIAGSTIWFYTLMIPALAKSGLMDSSILVSGPFGVTFLNPESLMGIKDFHYLTHSVFWTMLFNCGGIVLGSLAFPQSNSEIIIAEDFAEIDNFQDDSKIATTKEDQYISLDEKLLVVQEILNKYFNEDVTVNVIEELLTNNGLQRGQSISLVELAEVRGQAEKSLSGYIGSASAHFELQNSGLFSDIEKEALNKFYSNLLSAMNFSPKELSKKIILFQEKQKMMEAEQRILEERINQKSKELEEQKQKTFEASKLSALGEMSAGIAHEINNPLAIIQSATHLIEMGISKDRLTKEQILSNLAKIKSTVLRISKLIQGMRNLSRNTDGEEFSLVSFKDIINDSVALCAERFSADGIDLKVIYKNAPMEIELECRRISFSQVFINLLNNSHDAVLPLEQKWVKIEVSCDKEFLIIRFTDSGGGIPHDIKDKILQPFFTTKKIGSGTGLGLSLSASIIKGHDGYFTVDSDDPNTCFVFKVPLKHDLNQKIVA